MADEIDRAQEREAFWRDLALRKARQSGTLPPRATGRCLCCGELIGYDRRWCDVECRDYWERETRAHERC